jgi:hypothetical protein
MALPPASGRLPLWRLAGRTREAGRMTNVAISLCISESLCLSVGPLDFHLYGCFIAAGGERESLMRIEWDERKARRVQLQKFAAALGITCMIAAVPILVVGMRIGL